MKHFWLGKNKNCFLKLETRFRNICLAEETEHEQSFETNHEWKQFCCCCERCIVFKS